MTSHQDLQDQIDALKERVEAVIAANQCDDAALQQALIEVGRDRLWKQGLWTRIRYWANVVGTLGILGGALFWLSTLLGFEVVRR